MQSEGGAKKPMSIGICTHLREPPCQGQQISAPIRALHSTLMNRIDRRQQPWNRGQRLLA